MNNIELNFIELSKEYPYLQMKLVNDKYMIDGRVRIYATNDNVQLMDDFTIVMEVPLGFPNELPVIKETSNKIPKTFEHVNIDKSLCLGIETEIKIKFEENPTLLNWFQTFVVNYFYSAMYYSKYGRIPYGERPHGTKGIIQFYMDFLNVDSIQKIYDILNAIEMDDIKDFYKCPCGSFKKTRKCHLSQINLLKKVGVKSDLKEISKLIKRKKTVTFIYPYSNEEYYRRFGWIKKYNN